MDLENRLIKLESKLLEMDQINLELQVKVCKQGDKVDYLMDFIKTKFGDDDFPVEASDASSLLEIETNPVNHFRKIKDTTANIVNQSAEVVNSDQDDNIPSESEATNDWPGRSGDELNGVEPVEVAIGADEPIPGSSKIQPAQKKKKVHTRHGRTNGGANVEFALRTQGNTTTSMGSLIHAEKRFVCDWADFGKRYAYRNSLNIHKRTHSEEQLHICKWENCGKRFSKFCRLVEHTFIHTGERDYSCHYQNCGRRFIRKSNLTTHLKIHTGEKPYECDLPDCGKRFARKYHLTRHLKLK